MLAFSIVEWARWKSSQIQHYHKNVSPNYFHDVPNLKTHIRINNYLVTFSATVIVAAFTWIVYFTCALSGS